MSHLVGKPLKKKRDSVMEFFRKGSANHPPPPILSYGTVDKHVILVTKILFLNDF